MRTLSGAVSIPSWSPKTPFNTPAICTGEGEFAFAFFLEGFKDGAPDYKGSIRET